MRRVFPIYSSSSLLRMFDPRTNLSVSRFQFLPRILNNNAQRFSKPVIFLKSPSPVMNLGETRAHTHLCVKQKILTHTQMAENLRPTKLEYYDEMFKLQSTATLLSSFLNEDGRQTLVLDSTIFHPQGGGQPSDKGFISSPQFKFIVEDVRSKDKIVYHYGYFETPFDDNNIQKGAQVLLNVDEDRRRLSSRLHSAGHLLDICVRNVGWEHLEPTKGHHFPDGPFVEYKGAVPQNELQSKQKEIELEASDLISKGGKVSVSVLPYDKASEMCGGSLPDYIPKDSTPRIVKLGESSGCPCGGTHVGDINEISGLKVSQIRTKKGLTKIFYNVG